MTVSNKSLEVKDPMITVHIIFISLQYMGNFYYLMVFNFIFVRGKGYVVYTTASLGKFFLISKQQMYTIV